MNELQSKHDKQIILDIRSGGRKREQALERLYTGKVFQVRLPDFLKTMGMQSDKIQEIRMETFEAVYNAILHQRYNETASLETFSLSIARNKAINRFHRDKRLEFPEQFPEAAQPEAVNSFSETTLSFESIYPLLISDLTEQQKYILNSRLEKVPYDEIAKELKLKPESARLNYSRILGMLREKVRRHPGLSEMIEEALKNDLV